MKKFSGHIGIVKKSGVSRRAIVLAVGGMMIVPLLGLAAGKSKKERGPAARLSEAPPAAITMPNPFAGQADAAQPGRKLYQQHCAQCHGPEARGWGRAPDLHSPTIQSASPGTLFWAVRNGRLRQGMPAWAHLPDQQIWQIVTYLKTLNQRP